MLKSAEENKKPGGVCRGIESVVGKKEHKIRENWRKEPYQKNSIIKKMDPYLSHQSGKKPLRQYLHTGFCIPFDKVLDNGQGEAFVQCQNHRRIESQDVVHRGEKKSNSHHVASRRTGGAVAEAQRDGVR